LLPKWLVAHTIHFLQGYAAVSELAALGIAIGFKKIRRRERMFGASALYLVVKLLRHLLYFLIM
jgi:hypothetical protein